MFYLVDGDGIVGEMVAEGGDRGRISYTALFAPACHWRLLTAPTETWLDLEAGFSYREKNPHFCGSYEYLTLSFFATELIIAGLDYFAEARNDGVFCGGVFITDALD